MDTDIQLVVKSNALIEAVGRLTVAETKLILAAMCAIVTSHVHTMIQNPTTFWGLEMTTIISPALVSSTLEFPLNHARVGCDTFKTQD